MEIMQETFSYAGILTLTQHLALLISLAKQTIFPACLKKFSATDQKGRASSSLELTQMIPLDDKGKIHLCSLQ